MSVTLNLPGIGYKQGSRQMVVTAMDPVALVKLVNKVDHWNPLGQQPHGNRPQNPAHRQGIKDYLESEEEWVLGAVVLYVSPEEARWIPQEGSEGTVTPGTLTLSIGAEFDVGDGQHRIGALSDVLNAHDEKGDEVLERLRRSGQPAVVVIDESPLHRAQDFTDLQRNVKPPTGSLSLSMDRRQPINTFLIELVQRSDLPIFGGGDKVEFLKDSPGKLSAKLFSFKTVRYMTGTALVGVSQRSTVGWEKAVNAAVSSDRAGVMDEMVDLWKGLGALAGFAEVASGDLSAATLRERSLLTTAGVQYAISFALFTAHENGFSYGDAANALMSVDFDRPRSDPNDPPPSEDNPVTPKESIFAGNLVDPYTGKVASGRPAWEAAGDALFHVIKTKAKSLAA